MELTLSQYLKFIWIDRQIVGYIENDEKLKERIMYKLRQCRRKESSKDKILRTFRNYYS
jgi:hypothetical protein